MNNKLKLTLAILKPDVVKVPFVLQQIRQIMLNQGFYVVRFRELNFSREDARLFYLEHEGRFFHNRLLTFMTR